jgi:SAM-dependent methyltransferase
MGTILCVQASMVYEFNTGAPVALTPHRTFVDAVLAGRPTQGSWYAKGLPNRWGCDPAAVSQVVAYRSGLMNGPFSLDALPCRITGDGRFELLDGHHRASRAIAEGCEWLQVDIREVSPMWAAMERDLWAIYGGASLYEEVEHPWFGAWQQRRSSLRVRAMRDGLERLGVSCGSALDLGACTGRFSRELVRLGFSAVDCVDQDLHVLRIAARFAVAFGLSAGFRWHCADAAEWLRANVSGRWNAVLVLSLLHHWLRTRAADIRDVLGRLDEQADVIVLDVPAPADAWCDGGQVKLADAGPFLCSCLPGRAALEWGTHDGRKMLAFQRPRQRRVLERPGVVLPHLGYSRP